MCELQMYTKFLNGATLNEVNYTFSVFAQGKGRKKCKKFPLFC